MRQIAAALDADKRRVGRRKGDTAGENPRENPRPEGDSYNSPLLDDAPRGFPEARATPPNGWRLSGADGVRCSRGLGRSLIEG